MSIVKRIIESYILEKQEYDQQPLEYKIGKDWEIWLKNNKYFYQDILKRKEKTIEDNLAICGSLHLTAGLSLVGNIPKNEQERKRMAETYAFLHGNWKELSGLSDKVLLYPDREKLFGIMIRTKGFQTVPASLRWSYGAMRIKEISDGDIAEIGGGFGGVPFHLFKDFNFKYKYYNFDLPEILVFCKYFLLTTFPEKKILLFGEDDFSNADKYDIILMPNWKIRELKEVSMVFNSYSLAEMEDYIIVEYLGQINRVCKDYFLEINHEHLGIFSTNNATSMTRLEDSTLKNWKRIYKIFAPIPNDLITVYLEKLYERRKIKKRASKSF